MIFGKKNQREAMHGVPTSPVAAARGWARDRPCSRHSLRQLVPFFRHKKANIQKKIVLKFQPNRSYGSPGI